MTKRMIVTSAVLCILTLLFVQLVIIACLSKRIARRDERIRSQQALLNDWQRAYETMHTAFWKLDESCKRCETNNAKLSELVNRCIQTKIEQSITP